MIENERTVKVRARYMVNGPFLDQVYSWRVVSKTIYPGKNPWKQLEITTHTGLLIGSLLLADESGPCWDKMRNAISRDFFRLSMGTIGISPRILIEKAEMERILLTWLEEEGIQAGPLGDVDNEAQEEMYYGF